MKYLKTYEGLFIPFPTASQLQGIIEHVFNKKYLVYRDPRTIAWDDMVQHRRVALKLEDGWHFYHLRTNWVKLENFSKNLSPSSLWLFAKKIEPGDKFYDELTSYYPEIQEIMVSP